MIEELSESLWLINYQTMANAHTLAIILAVLWGAFIITSIDNRLLLLGIIPRTIQGLPGIICAPFLHANFNHLFFNSIPLVVLSNFILIYGVDYYLLVTAMITILSGLAIWCFAKPGLHIGASAVVTGYWGFLVSNIYNMGTVTNLILGVICLYYFAGIFLGIFPSQKGVSWQGHLFGLLAGFATSYLLRIYSVL